MREIVLLNDDALGRFEEVSRGALLSTHKAMYTSQLVWGLPFSTYAILHAIWTHPPP